LSTESDFRLDFFLIPVFLGEAYESASKLVLEV